MSDSCYMSVTCRRIDKARFEELGFHVEWGENENSAILELVDEEANYAHFDQMPTDIPFTARNGAGSEYGDARLVCDGKVTVEVPTSQDGSFCIDWDFRAGKPKPKSIQRIRRYLRVEQRVKKLFKKLRQKVPHQHLFSPHTHLCVKCGIHANDDAVENQPCSK